MEFCFSGVLSSIEIIGVTELEFNLSIALYWKFLQPSRFKLLLISCASVPFPAPNSLIIISSLDLKLLISLYKKIEIKKPKAGCVKGAVA